MARVKASKRLGVLSFAFLACCDSSMWHFAASAASSMPIGFTVDAEAIASSLARWFAVLLLL